MTTVSAELATALRRVEDSYYNAADHKNFALIETVFAKDALVTYHHGTPQELTISGREAVIAQLVDVVGSFAASTHVLANFSVEMTPTGPRSITHAIANVVLGEKILVRGLRYTDEFTQEDGAWKILRRWHEPMWQHQAAAMPPVLK